jgi:hypothetical protein
VTHKHDTAAVAGSRLEELARSWLDGEWTDARTRELLTLVHRNLDAEQAWALFRDLAEAVRLRDGVNDGTVHWREVCPKLTGPNFSDDAYDIACGLVDNALQLLVHGRPR